MRTRFAGRPGPLLWQTPNVPNTPQGLPYPTTADAPNISGDLESLARAVDSAALFGEVRTVAVPAGTITASGTYMTEVSPPVGYTSANSAVLVVGNYMGTPASGFSSGGHSLQSLIGRYWGWAPSGSARCGLANPYAVPLTIPAGYVTLTVLFVRTS